MSSEEIRRTQGHGRNIPENISRHPRSISRHRSLSQKDVAKGKNTGHAKGMKYITTHSPIGRLLVAVTSKGIRWIGIDKDDRALINALHKEFPGFQPRRSKDILKLACIIREHIMGKGDELDIQLDITGTELQRDVWNAIRQIPAGETRSYTDIAAQIGKPHAIRAVANACASNKLPILIPCHRVIMKDGSLGGYGLGQWRKKWLLEREYQILINGLTN